MLLLTILFSIVLNGPVSYLAWRDLPRTLGVLVVIGTLVVLLWPFSIVLAPSVREQAHRLMETFLTLLGQAMNLIDGLRTFFGLDHPIEPDPQSLTGAAGGFIAQGGMLEAGVEITIATVISLGL